MRITHYTSRCSSTASTVQAMPVLHFLPQKDYVPDPNVMYVAPLYKTQVMSDKLSGTAPPPSRPSP